MINKAPDFHTPVLGPDVSRWLVTDPSGVYVDATVGGGGHAESIVEELGDAAGEMLQRAAGTCKGEFHLTGSEGMPFDASGELECPSPGGRFQSSFLRNLSEWIPPGIAKDVVEQELQENKDFYFQEARLVVSHNQDGFWRFHLKIKNPRLHLDIPIDITDQSVKTVSQNNQIKRLLEQLNAK